MLVCVVCFCLVIVLSFHFFCSLVLVSSHLDKMEDAARRKCIMGAPAMAVDHNVVKKTKCRCLCLVSCVLCLSVCDGGFVSLCPCLVLVLVIALLFVFVLVSVFVCIRVCLCLCLCFSLFLSFVFVFVFVLFLSLSLSLSLSLPLPLTLTFVSLCPVHNFILPCLCLAEEDYKKEKEIHRC